MSELSKQTLLSLRDFIGDALSDPDVTAREIAQAIIDELTELVEYHSTAHSKAKEALSLLDRNDDVSDAWDYFVKDDAVESSQDLITFGDYENNYNFKLSSDYLTQAGQPVDTDNLWGSVSKDTVDFTNYMNRKNRKNKDK
jgi:hypothetical protein